MSDKHNENKLFNYFIRIKRTHAVKNTINALGKRCHTKDVAAEHSQKVVVELYNADSRPGCPGAPRCKCTKQTHPYFQGASIFVITDKFRKKSYLPLPSHYHVIYSKYEFRWTYIYFIMGTYEKLKRLLEKSASSFFLMLLSYGQEDRQLTALLSFVNSVPYSNCYWTEQQHALECTLGIFWWHSASLNKIKKIK